jgi:hypothetical protein
MATGSFPSLPSGDIKSIGAHLHDLSSGFFRWLGG